MSTLFISHSSSDAAAAEDLSRRLADPPRNHHSVFLDLDPEQGIVAGQSWERTLYRKLRSCRAVIALITDAYLGSQWCFAEIALARMEGKHIFALLADPLGEGAKLPAILTEKQFIDLRRAPEDGYRRLWRGLEELDLIGVAGEWDSKESPYLGLRAYQEKHAAVFFGRGAETRAGIELLDRGAPGLIMVLGSSGSGKSSLVRAGMVPRLRRAADRWLVVDPFRPRRDPAAELADALAAAYRRYAPERAAREGSVERLRTELESGLPRPPLEGAEAATESGSEPTEDLAAADERLRKLMGQLEELRRSPPQGAGPPMMKFLDWSLEDLRRICGVPTPVPTAAAAAAGGSPLVEIADRLRRASGHPNARVLLVIDQFEELLGRDDPGDRDHRFLKLLRDTVEAEHGPLMALGTMRSDFLGLFQRNRALREVDFESLSVGPMSVDAMRRVIEEPAKLGAIELEPGLADRLLADTETPDALPLLSFTLWRLWEDRQHGRLTVGQYEKLGGLHGAVAREAEAVLETARKQGREDDVRAAFLQMARLTEDGGYARQPVSWDREELQKVKPILEAFEQRRLLVTRQEEGESSATLEVAHEALFRSWAPLVSWLEDNRAELLLEQQLRRDAVAWQQSGRAKDSLWSGVRLQQARELQRRRAPGAGEAEDDLEGEFVRRGLRRRRWQRVRWAALALAFVAVLTGAWVKDQLNQRDLANTLARSHWAEGRRLRGEGESFAALHRLAAAAAIAADARLAESIHLDVSKELWEARRIVVLPDTRLRGARFLEDGSRLATAGDNGTAVWDGHSGERLAAWEIEDPEVRFTVFSPDGRRALTLRADDTAQLWDGATGERLGGPMVRLRHGDFSPDGSRLITRGQNPDTALWNAATGEPLGALTHEDLGFWRSTFSVTGDRLLTEAQGGIAVLWNSATGEKLGVVAHEDGSQVKGVALSPDGRRLLSWTEDGAVRLWSATTLEVVRTLTPAEGASGTGAELSPDGSRFLTEGFATAQLWDSIGEPLGLLEHEAGTLSSGALFSRDSARLLTWYSDGTADLWDGSTGEAIRALTGVGGAEFSPDGSRLLTWTYGSAQLWHGETGEPLGSRMVHLRSSRSEDGDGGLQAGVLSPDGSRVLTWYPGSLGWLWNSAREEQLRATMGASESLNIMQGAMFSPDDSRVLTWAMSLFGVGGTALLWDSATGKQLGEPMVEEGAQFVGARFSETENRLLTWNTDGSARLWDSATGGPLDTWAPAEGAQVEGVVFSPDGSRVVALVADGTARLWDTASHEMLGDLMHPEGVELQGAQFSQGDGRRLVTLGSDDHAILWDGVTGEKIVGLTSEEGAFGSGPVFSRDGQRLLTWEHGGSGQLWDGESGRRLKVLARDEGVVIWSAAFSPDGGHLLTWGENTALLWNGATGEEPRVVDPEENTSFQEALFSPDGRRFLSWGSRGPTQVWDTATASLLGVLSAKIEGARFSGDGSRLLTWDGETAQLWDTGNGRSLGNSFAAGSGALFSADESSVLGWGVLGAGLWDLGDLDFPRNSLPLAARVLTSTELDFASAKVKTMSPGDWLAQRKTYQDRARKHYQSCRYPRANLFRRFHPEEAKKLRPEVPTTGPGPAKAGP